MIKLRSEASGTVPNQGVSPLNWLFTPLEARGYSVQVPVLLGDNSVEMLTLQVRGKAHRGSGNQNIGEVGNRNIHQVACGGWLKVVS